MSFSWEKKDEIAVFNANDDTAYEYGTENGDGNFAYTGEAESYPKEKVVGKYAFYPYSILVSSGAEGTATKLSRNSFYVDLDGVTVDKTTSDSYYSYGDDDAIATFPDVSLKMPMVSDVNSSTGTFKFKNLTALMQVVVRNIPKGYNVAVLENAGTTAIAGRAKVDVVDQTLTMTTENAKTAIAYKWTADEEKLTSKTFYFIIPEGEYSTGFDFYLDKTSNTSTKPLPVFSDKKLSIKRNYIYATEVTINGDGDGAESTGIKEANEELANKGTEVTVDMTKVTEANGIIILPKLYTSANNDGTVTLVIKGNTTDSKKITIVEDPAVETGAVAKNVIIKGLENTNAVALDIQLENSTVTLADGSTNNAGASFSTVDSETSEEGLVVSKGVTIVTSLTINKGNVFWKEGAALTASDGLTTKDSYKAFLFYDKEATTSGLTTDTDITVVPNYVYDILTATGKKTIKADTGIENLTKSITVKEGADLTINLNGYTLASTTVPIFDIDQNATVTFVDDQDGTAGEDKTGTISTTNNTTLVSFEGALGTTPAIQISNGGKVELQAGLIQNTGGTAVYVNGKNSKFTLTGGKVASNDSKDGILVYNEAAIALNGGEVAGGFVRMSGAEVSNVAISLPKHLIAINSTKTLTVKKSDGGKDITIGNVVRADKAVVEVNANELKGGLEVTNGGQLTLNEGNVTGRVNFKAGTGNTFIMNGGTINNTTDNVAIATIAGSVVTINGGTITSTKKSAISLTSSTVTIDGASTKISATADNTDAIVDTEGEGSKLTIKNGQITSDKGAALVIKNGTEVTVEDGTIEGATYAVDIQSGKLTVDGDGAPTFTGATTISAVPATTDGVTVTIKLDAAGATYNANKDSGYYAVFNHKDDSKAGAAIQSISGGHFNGDIISDQSEYFISGGYFKNCKNLEDTANLKYFVTTKKPGTADAEGYWGVVDRTL
jgi:hypothetical protein